MNQQHDRDTIWHAFGLPPWTMPYTDDWSLGRRMLWRIRHPRRAWRVAVENRRAQ